MLCDIDSIFYGIPDELLLIVISHLSSSYSCQLYLMPFLVSMFLVDSMDALSCTHDTADPTRRGAPDNRPKWDQPHRGSGTSPCTSWAGGSIMNYLARNGVKTPPLSEDFPQKRPMAYPRVVDCLDCLPSRVRVAHGGLCVR